MANPIDASWLLQRLSRHEALSDAARASVAALPLVLRTYEPNQYILREGDTPKTCAFLQSGFVFRHKIVGNGGRQIVSVHMPGDFVDVQNILLGHADHNIQALTAVELITVAIDDMMAAAAAHPRLARALWHESLVEASIMREWIANVGRRDAYARTAHLLCELAIRSEMASLGSRESFHLSMTQEQIGDTLGLTSVHVNRTLKTLEAEGLITRNKRSVTVAQWRKLQSAGDFTSTYLHLPDAA